MRNSTPISISAITFVLLATLWTSIGLAADFEFANITDNPGGPGQGTMPSLNISGDIAFAVDSAIYFYDTSSGTFLDIMTLANAPARGWFPRLNDSGNIVFIDPDTRHLWLFEAAGQVFTDLATLTGFPGTSAALNVYGAFDANNLDQVVMHVGDNNFGDIHVYDHGSGTFTKITDRPDSPTHGNGCRINNNGQVAYNGYPDTYRYDPATEATLNITDLPGGPGTGLPSAVLNDLGDIAISSGDELVYFNAQNLSFWYLSTLPGFPTNSGSVDRNCLADNGSISFWAGDIFYFDPADSSFTQLTSQGAVPFSGLGSAINDVGVIVFEAGGDIWRATPTGITGVPLAASQLLLARNSPNPFNPATLISYEVPVNGANVRLEIFNPAGRLVGALVAERQPAGPQTIRWDGQDDHGRAVASGLYLCRLQVDGVTAILKMQLLR